MITTCVLRAVTFAILATSVCACSNASAALSDQKKELVVTDKGSGNSDQPAKVFKDLDAYLAHLKHGGTFDKPFYEEVEPGLYRLNTGRGSQSRPQQYFTRDELMKKFGFTK